MSAISSEAKVRRWGREPRGKRTIGLLQRRHIQIEKIKYIGKESNSLEAVEAGMIHSLQDAYGIP